MDSYRMMLQISLNTLEEKMNKCQDELFSYIGSHATLLNVASKSNYDNASGWRYEVETLQWLEGTKRGNPFFEGCFVYYQDDHDHYLFRGAANYKIHQWIKRVIPEESVAWNQWGIQRVDGQDFLTFFFRYGQFVCGAWVRMDLVREELLFDHYEEDTGGAIYLVDQKGVRSFATEKQSSPIVERFLKKSTEARHRENSYILVSGKTVQLAVGMLLEQDFVFENIPFSVRLLFGFGVVVFVLVPIVLIWLWTRISRPMAQLKKGIHQIGTGYLDHKVVLIHRRKTQDEFDELAESLNYMVDKVRNLEQRLYLSKIKEQEIELKYISSKIRPHFILNALNIIYTYDESELPLIRKMVLYLSRYFRYIVNLNKEFATVENEFRFVENYLKIQKERYESKFFFIVEWDHQVSECLLPVLMVQTFVENSIKHGMTNNQFCVYVLADLVDDTLHITIGDTGKGISSEVLFQIQSFLDSRNPQEDLGVGIQNTIARMDILYGKEVNVQIRNAESGGAVVEMFLPIEKVRDSDNV